jgi:hypothetical protein
MPTVVIMATKHQLISQEDQRLLLRQINPEDLLPRHQPISQRDHLHHHRPASQEDHLPRRQPASQKDLLHHHQHLIDLLRHHPDQVQGDHLVGVEAEDAKQRESKCYAFDFSTDIESL